MISWPHGLGRARGRVAPGFMRASRRRGARRPQAVAVHALVVVAVGAALDRLPPGAVLAVPRDRRREPLVERPPRAPAGRAQAATRRARSAGRGPAGRRRSGPGRRPAERGRGCASVTSRFGTSLLGAHVEHLARRRRRGRARARAPRSGPRRGSSRARSGRRRRAAAAAPSSALVTKSGISFSGNWYGP